MRSVKNKLIYLDNAATSWPKPPQMIEAMCQFSDHIGANPGRSGHQRSIQSARIVYETRQRFADHFNCHDPLRIVFSSNVTEAINLALFGLLKPGDHVITTSMEHNAVMRPLRHLQSQGIDLSVVKCSGKGVLDPADIKREIRPNTILVVITHASNLTGTLMPVSEVGKITRENDLLLLVDAAQTTGVYPIDMHEDCIDLLAFTGHKSLYGPMGTGGLAIGDRIDLNRLYPLKMGGTGSNSEKEVQPDFLPDKFESGTLNVIGLAGLNASLAWIESVGLEKIRNHEEALCKKLNEGLKYISAISLYGPEEMKQKTAVVSFTIKDMDNALVGELLDERYGILCRIGLHCAPSAAKTIGAFPQGTIRFSLGYFNQLAEIEYAIKAIIELSRGTK